MSKHLRTVVSDRVYRSVLRAELMRLSPFECGQLVGHRYVLAVIDVSVRYYS